jgi:hypothetical protein
MINTKFAVRLLLSRCLKPIMRTACRMPSSFVGAMLSGCFLLVLPPSLFFLAIFGEGAAESAVEATELSPLVALDLKPNQRPTGFTSFASVLFSITGSWSSSICETTEEPNANSGRDARSRSKDPLMILDDATDTVTCVIQSPSQYQHQNNIQWMERYVWIEGMISNTH